MSDEFFGDIGLIGCKFASTGWGLCEHPGLEKARTLSSQRTFTSTQRLMLRLAALLWLCCLASQHAGGQGLLTVLPGRTVATAAGTGKAGYGGDGAQATSAQLARPSGMAYDAAGDLFFADTNNHVVREITPADAISTVAGSGTAGFGGDNGPAIAAFLDTPTSVAVDSTGNLYIADSHNHRIRRVSQGTITTVAGNGTSGYAGDGGPATSAQLALPGGVAVDSTGTLYIADTNNHRIRRVSAGTITTVAGDGEELFAGDNGPATAASLDQPTAVALDAAGNLYIADKNNQRVRMVNASGVISTIAGNGSGGFSGAFSGDGRAATAASLAKPVSLTVDTAGNLYIADTNNQRIRQVSANGAITTLVGTGDQGFGGDDGPAPLAILNTPRGLTTDAAGNLAIADTRNQRLRSAQQPRLLFTSQAVGAASTSQPVTLSNTGSATLTIASLTYTGPFATAPGAGCSALPITLSPGASCTVNVVYLPTAVAPASGSLAIHGAGIAAQTVLLAGSTSQTATTLLLATSKPAILSGESLTLSATLSASGAGATNATAGTVSFYAGTVLLGSSALAQGVASLTTTAIPGGSQTLKAVFNGSGGFGASTSSAVVEAVSDFSISLTAAQAAATIVPGHTVSLPLLLPVQDATGLTGTVSLATATNIPGLTFTFTPATTPLSNGQLPFTMNVTAAPAGTMVAAIPLAGTPLLAYASLLLFTGRRRRNLLGSLGHRSFLLPLVAVLSFVGIAGLSGCGSNTGFFGQKPQTYVVNVTATATDSTGGTLTRTAPVTITVQ